MQSTENESLEKFWLARSKGHLSQARDHLIELEALAQEELGLELELELMKSSLRRSDNGPIDSDQFLDELVTRKPEAELRFQFHYQRALNSFAQGRYSLALEKILVSEKFASQAHEFVTMLTTRIICLDNLGFPIDRELTEIGSRLKSCSDPELKEFISSTLHSIAIHRAFRFGDFASIRPSPFAKGWSQTHYFCSLIASLPYARLGHIEIEENLAHLSQDVDFYMRTYRLQTLVGRAYETPSGTPTTWSERADRLYLWTWRWLASPSPSNHRALEAIMSEWENWDGHDVWTFDEVSMIRNALSWIMIFEPEYRTRWSRLLVRLERVPEEPNSLFALEKQFCAYVQAVKSRRDSEAKELRRSILTHEISNAAGFEMLSIAELLTSEVRLNPGVLAVDLDSGHILRNGESQLVSQPLANLIKLLADRHQASFSEIMEACYGISPYDPFAHDSKIQNLLTRARKLLGTSTRIITRQGWAVLDKFDSKEVQFSSANNRRRLVISKKTLSISKPTQLRNERSLSVLLKEASSLRGTDFSRQELELILGIPKPTLTRYLKIWTERGWIEKTGSGPKVSYRITFFES